MRSVIAVLAASLALCVASAHAADTITWLTNDLPPQYIVEGELAGQGIKDQQLRLIEAQTPEFQHRRVLASISRLWHEIPHTDGICGLGAQRTPEREKVAAFSRRPVLVPGFRVITKTDTAPLFKPFLTAQGEVDMTALLQARKLNGAYAADRIYPVPVSDYIASSDRRAAIDKTLDNERLFQLLRSNRVDFVFGLAYEAAYYSWEMGAEESVVSLPIKDAPRLVSGYAACSDRPIGRAMIAKIDALQADEKTWRALLNPLKRWLDPADFNVALAGTGDMR